MMINNNNKVDDMIELGSMGTTQRANSFDTFKGVQLTFKNITYTVPNKKYQKQLQKQKKGELEAGQKVEKELTILKNISGNIEKGEFVALMGPSGSGKSTLLDILAQRKSGTVTGQLLVNGKEIGDNYKKICSYVTQEDTLLQTATVFETLKFYADLRLPSYYTEEQKIARVDQVLDDIGLSKKRDSKIGGVLPGGIVLKALSGGEKRRVSIGCGLVTNPSLIFLDEPTSGLDSVTALSIMKTVLQLTKRGVTVVCSIHQPRPEIWSLFNKVMLVLKGKLVFSGTDAQLNSYFEDLGYPCPHNTNPADFYLDSAVELADSPRYDEVCEKWQHYWETEGCRDVALPELTFEKPQSISQFYMYNVLLRRAARDFVRNSGNFFARSFTGIAIGLLFGACFGGLGIGQGDIQKIAGVIFFLVSSLNLTPFTAIAIFISQRALFNAERAAKIYNTVPYYLATMTMEFIVIFTVAFLCTGVTYAIAHLRWNFARFLYAMLIYFLVHALSDFIIVGLSNAMPKMDIVFSIGSGVSVIYQLFAGFFVPVDQLPKAFGWLYRLNPLHYSVAALMVNEFEDRQLECPETGLCQFPTGQDVLVAYGVDGWTRGTAFAVVLSWTMLFFVLSCVALGTLNKEKR
ncbi:hypothetical protein CYY_009676 [Polysphondylium violaceum]|uniref:ABC transporter domain-containing protein n=1 Tax=Polysphondylium violaceum TaxID=133409 RepID=A0A8J4PL32_9MYCE|nr:hypothetical protein CYY_009676 [Polysphondylium violaceum]